jgi:primosomal protein N' (replication factor Y)
VEQFFEIGINVPGLNGVFDYHAPAHLAGNLRAGMLVVVPLGNRRVQGVVIRPVESPSVPETRAIEALVDPLPVLTPAQIALAQKLAEDTLSPLGACLELMLPAGLSQQADTRYQLTPQAADKDPADLKPAQARLVALLRERGALRGRQIEALVPHKNWQASLKALQASGWVVTETVLPAPDVRVKVARQVQLIIAAEEINHLGKPLGSPGSAAYQRRLAALQFLAKENRAVDLAWVYAASQCNAADMRRMAEFGWVAFRESEVLRDPLEGLVVEADTPPVLTSEQQAAWEQLTAHWQKIEAKDSHAPLLIHGVTGSGKTEIYLRAVAAALERGRQALVLVPEIALTPQTVRRFMARFPGKVGIIHSRLSPGERYDTWRQARAGLLEVIVGPRSALFVPLPNPGLIILDECHDPSYYQSEPAPAYHTVRAAAIYGQLTNSLVIYGSATPDVSLMYQAEQRRWPVIRMPQRVMGHTAQQSEPAFIALPQVNLVDMRQELKAGNRSMFSRALQDAIGGALKQNQQVILYLNRLGTASYVFCRSCGAVVRCPRCERPLTYHNESHLLVCHTCNYRRQVPKTCPQCGSTQIRQFGAGTERVEQELLNFYPQARCLRWDSDTTRQKGAHDRLLTAFSQHQADVLIGTQMLAKGLDFPLVTVVGVVLADVGLSLGDYRAGERTFQLLMQVAGRAGRSQLGGSVIMQTFQPEAYPVVCAARQDYAEFFTRELAERRDQNYPPFVHLVRLELRRPRLEEMEGQARLMAAKIQAWMEAAGAHATRIIGPAPCYFPKLAGQYRWQILLAGPDPARILRGKDLGEWRVEVDPQTLL